MAMASKDLFSNVLLAPVIPPDLYKASDDAEAVVIDTRGFQSVTLLLSIGDVTDAQALTLQKSPNDGDYTDVLPADVVGGEEALTAFKAVGADDGGQVKMLGYLGKESYLKVSCTGAGATGATFGVAVMLGHPQLRPAQMVQLAVEENGENE
jgi:hypothetical protein